MVLRRRFGRDSAVCVARAAWHQLLPEQTVCFICPKGKGLKHPQGSPQHFTKMFIPGHYKSAGCAAGQAVAGRQHHSEQLAFPCKSKLLKLIPLCWIPPQGHGHPSCSVSTPVLQPPRAPDRRWPRMDTASDGESPWTSDRSASLQSRLHQHSSRGV